jgi:hypothetical protein
MWNPLQNQEGAGGARPGGGSPTKVSLGICIAMGVVSFLGYLPRFAPFCVLSVDSIVSIFPKPWVLITSTFYSSSLFSGFLQAGMVVLIGRIVEPIIGSREYLRLFLMIGFFTNILMFVFALLASLIIADPMVKSRPFEVSSAPSTALLMTMAHLLRTVELPTMCGRLKIRLLPFYMYCLTLILGFISGPDILLASTFSLLLSYFYIRYIKKNGNTRGDPTFGIWKLLPDCGADADDAADTQRQPGGHITGLGDLQRGANPEMGDEHHNFRLDNNPSTPPPTSHSQFQGRPRTLGNDP